MKIIIPPSLKKGDIIGIVAPSNYIEEKDLEYINASVNLMETEGYRFKFGKYIFENTTGYGTSAIKKAEDINLMFADKDVKAIFCAKGGEDSNSILDYLDYELIKSNPKIICGFSDNTSVLDVITDKTGIVTYHGPTFKSLTSWQTIYAYKEFKKMVCEHKKTLGEIDDEYKVLNKGKAEGRLIGGNLSLFTKLVTGKYSLELEGKILFLEETGFESTPQTVNSNIYYLKQNKVFDKIAGLWIGNYENISKITLEEVILNAIDGEYDFPIIKSNNFGHIDKKITIPVGANARIDTDQLIKIKLVD